MDHETIKNDDIIQLKQMIIFLKAELIKYETIDSISEMNRLKQENYQLLTENETLISQLEQLKNTVARPIKEREIDWTPVNEKFAELLKIVKENTDIQKKNDEMIIQQFSEKMIGKGRRIQKYEEKVKQLENDLEEKNRMVMDLQAETDKLEHENKKLSKKVAKISPETIKQMDLQMEEVMQKALVYTTQIDEKLDILQQIETELMKVLNTETNVEIE